ncbi:MAG TPA: hypothetical protein DCP05_02400 [Rhodospirillaceae bacterium]|nr:hypothetical protein [Rhodospirillaceae bacterium]
MLLHKGGGDCARLRVRSGDDINETKLHDLSPPKTQHKKSVRQIRPLKRPDPFMAGLMIIAIKIMYLLAMQA